MEITARGGITVMDVSDGKNGVNAVRLDLDNENDTMLYDGAGTLISDYVTSNPTLYDGATAVTSGVKYAIEKTGCVASFSETLKSVVVTDMTEDTGSVTVKATYNGVTYKSILSLKRLVGVDKYDLSLSANSVKVDADGNLTPSAIAINVYRTAQNGTREQLDAVPDGFTLDTGQGILRGGDDLPIAITPTATDKSYTVTLRDADDNTLDRETVPVVADGAAGAGVTITEQWTKYATTETYTRPDEASEAWQTAMPTEPKSGLYLWTWTHVEYSSGEKTNAYSVSRTGIDGKGIKSSVVEYSLQENSVVAEDITDWSAKFPTELTDGWWLYTRTTVTYSDGGTAQSYGVSQVGTGSYYAGLQEYYAVSDSATEAPTGCPNTNADGSVMTVGAGEDVTPTSPWQTSRPTYTTAQPYLWNFEISRDSRGNAYVTAPVCIGNFAKGIASIVEAYAISAFSKPALLLKRNYPADISEWTDEQQDAAPTTDKPYQWNKTVTKYNDDTSDTFYHVSAVKGDTGAQGKQGEQGDPGDGGWAWSFSPAVLTFETDEDGKLPETLEGNTATLTVNVGGVDNTPTITSAKGARCTAEKSGNVVTITEIDEQTVEGRTVPYSSGYVTVTAEYDGKQWSGQIAFTVGVTASMAKLTITQDEIKTQVTELSSDVKEAQSGVETLTTEVSSIDQKADKISLKVERTAVTGRNLLAGSMMRRVTQDNTANHVMQAYLTAGKTYTLSARGMASAALLAEGRTIDVFVFDDDWTEGNYKSVSFNSTEWATKEVTITPTKTGVFNVYACVCLNHGDSPTTTAGAYGAVMWAQLEEGEVATPWTGRDEDYHVRPNLITEWTEAETIEGVTLADGSQGEVAHCDNSGGTGIVDLAYKNQKLTAEARKTYTLSFMAKGTGNIGSFLYTSSEVCVGAINGVGDVYNSGDGMCQSTLTAEWKMYTATFTVKDSPAAGPHNIIAVRAYAGSVVYAYGFRLEEGGMATDGTLTNGLLATGIDIENKKVYYDADKHYFRSNSGTQLALFTEKDGKGYFNTDMIEAETVVANGIKAQTIDAESATFSNVNITGSSTFGGMMIKTPTYFDALTYADYITQTTDEFGSDVWLFNFKKITPYIIFGQALSQLASTFTIHLPQIIAGTYTYVTESGLTKQDMRGLVGNTVILVNDSGAQLNICSAVDHNYYLNGYLNGNVGCFYMPAGSVAKLECVWGNGTTPTITKPTGEYVFWTVLLSQYSNQD